MGRWWLNFRPPSYEEVLIPPHPAGPASRGGGITDATGNPMPPNPALWILASMSLSLIPMLPSLLIPSYFRITGIRHSAIGLKNRQQENQAYRTDSRFFESPARSLGRPDPWIVFDEIHKRNQWRDILKGAGHSGRGPEGNATKAFGKYLGGECRTLPIPSE